ncbi:amidase [Mumia sp. zg.B21]|uniref:amidase n=1 Tax=Mumia sp. zg.B21 TaxID=2855447 RepID=UPI001C6EBC36|nr:amidase [Mumia sp. zg.B21]MBW9208300.1 amidase [Mumia sp. zg.B21]
MPAQLGTPPASALALAAAYRSDQTDPVAVVDRLLERIGVLDAEVGAFVTVTADEARAAALSARDALRGSGADALPPMFGVPTALKDLTPTAGVRTTYGSAAFADLVPETDGSIAVRVASAGMISLGKTSTPELGLPCYTEPDVAPPSRTPYDLSRGAGGSSGGAAAAVAAGLVPVAVGSDGGGSVRIPASSCGLVGIKVSRGLVAGTPEEIDVAGLSVPGTLALTVGDAAAMLDVVALTGSRMLDACGRAPGRLRVARFCDPVISELPPDPEVVAAYEETSRLLERLGHDVVDVAPPFGPDTVAAFETAWFVGAASVDVPPEREGLLRPLTRWERDRGRAATGVEYAAALLAMRQAEQRTLEAYAGYDVVLTPTLGQLPALVGSLRDDADPVADFEAQKGFTPYTSVWNIAGAPALSLPTGWSRTGLPIGTMIAGKPGAEPLLLSLAAQVEHECSSRGNPWRRPRTVMTDR